jgi:hypothetical protein
MVGILDQAETGMPLGHNGISRKLDVDQSINLSEISDAGAVQQLQSRRSDLTSTEIAAIHRSLGNPARAVGKPKAWPSGVFPRLHGKATEVKIARRSPESGFETFPP